MFIERETPVSQRQSYVVPGRVPKRDGYAGHPRLRFGDPVFGGCDHGIRHRDDFGAKPVQLPQVFGFSAATLLCDRPHPVDREAARDSSSSPDGVKHPPMSALQHWIIDPYP